MVLNKGECVLCNGKEEQFAVAGILEENGYKMFSNEFNLYCHPHDGHYLGFRWFTHREFPECIATLSHDMVNSVVNNGMIFERGEHNHFHTIDFEEFMDRCSPQPLICVEDLL